MSGLGEQRQRMSADAGHDQQHDVGQGHPQRDLQHPRRTARAMNVPVHSSSVRVDKTGFPHFSRGGSALMRPPRNLSRPRECRCGVQTGGRVAQTRPWVPKRNRTLARDLHHNQHPLGKDQFMDEIVKDFLIESNENLDRLDQELVKLESDPSSKELLASVFRTIHTIKGSCGFLGFARLEKLAHAGENLLSRLRDGKLTLSAEITSGLLAMVDAVRHMLAAIQASGQDGEEDYAPLIEALARLQGEPVAEPPAAPSRNSPDALLPPQSADAGGSTPTRELASKSSPVPSPHKPRRKPRAEKPMDPRNAVLVEGNSGGPLDNALAPEPQAIVSLQVEAVAAPVATHPEEAPPTQPAFDSRNPDAATETIRGGFTQ